MTGGLVRGAPNDRVKLRLKTLGGAERGRIDR
jgi:hypothetical protein